MFFPQFFSISHVFYLLFYACVCLFVFFQRLPPVFFVPLVYNFMIVFVAPGYCLFKLLFKDKGQQPFGCSLRTAVGCLLVTYNSVLALFRSLNSVVTFARLGRRYRCTFIPQFVIILIAFLINFKLLNLCNCISTRKFNKILKFILF